MRNDERGGVHNSVTHTTQERILGGKVWDEDNVKEISAKRKNEQRLGSKNSILEVGNYKHFCHAEE